MSIRIQIPPERNRLALERDKQAIGNAKHDVEDHDPADDPDVRAVDGDAKQEKANADFEGRGRKSI